MSFWSTVSRLGGYELALPLALLTGFGLTLSGQWRGALVWLAALATMMPSVFAWKLAFVMTGLGWPATDFAAPSGHAALALAIVPVMLGWLCAGAGAVERDASVAGAGLSNWGFALGMTVALAVAVSRMILGVHSTSEVVFGSVFGLMVSLVARGVLAGATFRPRVLTSALLGVFLALTPMAVPATPFGQLELHVARWLNPAGRRYNRSHLHTAATPPLVAHPRIDRPSS